MRILPFKKYQNINAYIWWDTYWQHMIIIRSHSLIWLNDIDASWPRNICGIYVSFQNIMYVIILSSFVFASAHKYSDYTNAKNKIICGKLFFISNTPKYTCYLWNIYSTYDVNIPLTKFNLR